MYPFELELPALRSLIGLLGSYCTVRTIRNDTSFAPGAFLQRQDFKTVERSCQSHRRAIVEVAIARNSFDHNFLFNHNNTTVQVALDLKLRWGGAHQASVKELIGRIAISG